MFYMNDWIELLQLGALLLLVLFFNGFLRRFLVRFKWSEEIDLIPIRVLLWLLFASYLFEVIAHRTALAIPDPHSFRNAGIVFCLAWFFLRWKSLFIRALGSRRISNKDGFDPTSIEILGKTYSIVIFFVAALLFLQILGLNIAPLLAFGGIGAATLGFASKDAITNFYGGLTIYLTRPFIVGDQVELPEKSLVGHIEKIGWYFTTLRDLSKKPVYIPNSFFTTELLVNQSRMTHRYIDERLSLRYPDASKIEALVKEIRRFLFSHPDIDRGQAIRVFLNAFAESALVLEIKAYTLSTRYEEFMEIRQKIMIRICEMVAEAGCGIGYPVQQQISGISPS